MTTEMKQLLALLLIGCAFTVRGEAEAERDPCTNGVGALEVYHGYDGCSGSKPSEYVDDLMSSIENNKTVNNLIRMFSNYCSTVFPKLAPCFQKNIENCTSSQRNTLMSLANSTGYACEPNTNKTNPVFQHLFSRLTNADLDIGDQCNEDGVLQAPMICHNRSLQVLGLSDANATQVMSSLGAKDLVTLFRTFSKTSLNCIVTHIRDNRQNCSAWRGKAIFLLRNSLLPSTLGINMNFTNADIDIMFGWPVQIIG